MTVIKNGTNGTIAEVTDENKLSVRSDTSTREENQSDEGLRYIITSGKPDLGATFDGGVLWFKNTDPSRHFHVTRIVLGWNGGDTNHNRVSFLTGTFNSTEPTANQTTITPSNSNLASNRTALMTAYKWDGVGTAGLTTTGGVGGAVNVVAQGENPIQLGGALILPVGSTFEAKITVEEAGVFSITIAGYYEDVES